MKDSLAQYDLPVADSFATEWHESAIPQSDPVIWRDTTSQVVYGSTSTTTPAERFYPTKGERLTENAVFQGFVILLATTYALLIYRNIGDVVTLLRRATRETNTSEHIFDSSTGSSFSRFLNLVTAIGILFMGVIVVKYGDEVMPGALSEALPHGAVIVLSLLVSLGFVAVVTYQTLATQAIGKLTLTSPFTEQIMLLKRIYFALTIIITSPWLLLYALCDQGEGGLWFFVILASIAVSLILYLKELLNLFLSKNISILHWFLYLCTVELFPVSLLVLAVMR